MGKLLLQGTTTKSAVQLAEAAAGLGGALEANVREDETALEIECLGDSTVRRSGLVAEVARTPAFPTAELARLRGDLLREVAIQRSQPQPLAEEAFAQAIYGNHPYGRVLPVAAEVEKFTLEQAKQLWTRFAGADRAHLYVVGRFDPAAVRQRGRGGIRRLEEGEGRAPARRRAPKGGRRVFLLDRPGAVQSTVRIGLPGHPADVAGLHPAGGDRRDAGRELRQPDHGQHPREAGLHLLAAERARAAPRAWAPGPSRRTSPPRTPRPRCARSSTRWSGCARSPRAAEELAGIRKYVAGTFVLRNSSRAGIVTQLRFVDLYGLPADWLRTFVQRVEAVTPADMTRVTKKYLDPQRMTLVVVGDRKGVEDSLKQFGPVKVEAPK